jgi:hemolysin III
MKEVTLWGRKQTSGEEIANSISHGLGFLMAVAITPVLIVYSVSGGAAGITGVCIFGATMIILYLASTLYHALPDGKSKRVFQILDHSAIFLLIAGTYTPFTLIVLPGAWGWSLFGMIWFLACVGVVIKTINSGGTSKLSIWLYLAMGWLAIVAAQPLYKNMSDSGLIWLLGGGLMYTAGVVFFATDHRVRYNHFIWHLFVIAGTVCHVVAVWTIIGTTPSTSPVSGL